MIDKILLPNKRNYLLSCILNNGRPNAPIVMMLHGFAGNKEENGLFREADEYFSKKNFNVFRFDFEGAGESQGEYATTSFEKQVEDLKTAIDYLSQSYPNNELFIIGFSLGATIAILLNDPRVKAYAFWSPALSPSVDMYPRYNNNQIINDLKTNGYFLKAGLKVGAQILEEFRDLIIDNYVINLKKPVLLMHGTGDQKISYFTTKQYKSLFTASELALVDGASHSFKTNPCHRKSLFDKSYTFFNKLV